ncbi:glycosyltransferase family 4 protein [Paenibacillus amylolyticus]|uniref:Glycosyltransferase family 4 protein n=1 Tax=Paenibacillus amylolyticus TaxID=1451 RepID=A0A5M9WVJ5_PAEAM|nr:glycosyltransferase family 4 protein [Paenibacillus amylolyticus]KAA8785646.1 glycosyltransferase family 4 protein [Paenibacillus amylolyticus]MDP9702724.1 glycosyltransferase involved in cell wall biosynthesis [Paenibacillus intestini]
MKDILIISPSPIKNKMSGPAIRYWEIAKNLSHEKRRVTVLVPNSDFIQGEGFVVKKLTGINLWNSLLKCDVVLLQGLSIWKYPFIKYFNKAVAIDLYDPFNLENLESFEKHGYIANLKYKTTMAVIEEQIQRGDFFYCASEKQKDYWLGMISAKRLTPKLYASINKDIKELIGTVPFGIPNEKPRKTQHKVIKGKCPIISENDKVVLWGGGIWDWLDPESLIQAMARVKRSRNDIKCFFMGVKPPSGGTPRKLSQLINLTKDLNLEDTVYFNDWVDYDQRSDYLLEADIGVSLHENHLETRFSYRTRLLDYVWCELPILASEGDVFAETIKKYNLGSVVSEKNIDEISKRIIEMINIGKQRVYPEENLEVFTWSSAVSNLIKFCDAPVRRSQRFNIISEVKFMVWRVMYVIIRLQERYLNKL